MFTADRAPSTFHRGRPTAGSWRLSATRIWNELIMKTTTFFITLIATIADAQDSKKTDAPAGTEVKPKELSAPISVEKPKSNTEELEAKFKTALTKATFSGRWCGIKDGKLTPEKEDKYTIVCVTKLGGEMWIINTRIQ